MAGPCFLTPARPLDEEVPAPRLLFPDAGQISLYEALHTVNQQCRFTDCLGHWSPRNCPPRPADRVFFVGMAAPDLAPYALRLGKTLDRGLIEA